MLPLDRLGKHALENGGTLSIVFNRDTLEHTVGYIFGQEEEGSPMAGGAAYAINRNLNAALEQVADEVGA